MIEKVNLAEKFGRITQPWQPKLVGEVNDVHVKLVKLSGEFVWHRHEQEDELFLVVRGRLVMRFRDRDVTLEAGELIVVPRGVDHLPVAEADTQVLLVEPATTVNTGNVRSDRTVERVDRI